MNGWVNYLLKEGSTVFFDGWKPLFVLLFEPVARFVRVQAGLELELIGEALDRKVCFIQALKMRVEAYLTRVEHLQPLLDKLLEDLEMEHGLEERSQSGGPRRDQGLAAECDLFSLSES